MACGGSGRVVSPARVDPSFRQGPRRTLLSTAGEACHYSNKFTLLCRAADNETRFYRVIYNKL